MLQPTASLLPQLLRAQSGAGTPKDATWLARQRALNENSNGLSSFARSSMPNLAEARRVQRAAIGAQPSPIFHVFHVTPWHQPLQPIGSRPESTVVGRVSRSGVTAKAWLSDALGVLHSCPADALEDDLNKPTTLALEKAELLLRKLAPYTNDEPDVYALDESNIALDWRNPDALSGVLFVVEADGSAVLYSRTRKSKGRIRVDDALDLLSEGALLELRKVGIQ